MITLRPGVWVLCFVALLSSALCAGESPPDALGTVVSDARLAELLTVAERSADAELELALALDERRELPKAAEHYRNAAAAGVGAAEVRLGAMAEVGEAVPQSYEAAREHYERAIRLGVPEANLRLGMLYLEGWGVSADPAQAVVLIERAATADYAPAQKILSDIYFVGVKVERDPARALVWAERAAAARDPEAATAVGMIRQRAAKLPQDLKLAREWYQLSAEQDYTRGMVAMASTFFRPGASPEDLKLGFRWLELAADGGNTAALFHLAGFYLLSPLSFDGDRIAMARTRLQASSAGGEKQAQEVLEMEKSGQPLAVAFMQIFQIPADQRYIQRLAADPRYAEDAKGNRLPRPIKLVLPVYPAALRLTGSEGEVLVEFTVDTTGRVRDAKIVRTTHPGFSDSALVSILSTRFQPGKRNGHLVNVRMQQPIFFSLSDIRGRQSEAQERAGSAK